MEKVFYGLNPLQVKQIYPLLSGQNLHDATHYLASGESLVLAVEGNLSERDMLLELGKIKGPRVADRDNDRLLEGRILDGSVRDLLPLPNDIDKYTALLPALFQRKLDPTHRFTQEEYAYYSRNLVHSPDNSLEMKGLLGIVGL